MKCSNCGEEIAEGSNFCEYCGAKVKQEKKSHIALWISIVAIVVAVVASALLFKNSRYYKVSQCHDYEAWAIDEIYNKVYLSGGYLSVNGVIIMDSIRRVFYENCLDSIESRWYEMADSARRRYNEYCKMNVRCDVTISIHYINTECEQGGRCVQKCAFDILVVDEKGDGSSSSISSQYCGDELVENIKEKLEEYVFTWKDIINVFVETDSEVDGEVLECVYEAVNRFKRETGSNCKVHNPKGWKGLKGALRETGSNCKVHNPEIGFTTCASCPTDTLGFLLSVLEYQ